jgi:hypothetical protein
MSLNVRNGWVFTRYCEAQESETEREELKFRKENATPLLVEKFVGYVNGRGLHHRKIEREMLKLRLMSL